MDCASMLCKGLWITGACSSLESKRGAWQQSGCHSLTAKEKAAEVEAPTDAPMAPPLIAGLPAPEQPLGVTVNWPVMLPLFCRVTERVPVKEPGVQGSAPEPSSVILE